MDLEKPIFCLEHCKGNKMLVFEIPEFCTYCGADLNQCSLRMPPFRLPTPFRDARNFPCAIVLKPTTGDFLKTYKNSDSLHIGLTNSSGVVFEFDSDGLRCDRSTEWTHCLAIKNFNKDRDFDSWSQFWDFTLDFISKQDNWSKTRYDEDRNNCYTFILTFLRALQTPEISSFARDRKLFCEKFILPKTAFAAKYITLHRKLMSSSSSNNF